MKNITQKNQGGFGPIRGIRQFMAPKTTGPHIYYGHQGRAYHALYCKVPGLTIEAWVFHFFQRINSLLHAF